MIVNWSNAFHVSFKRTENGQLDIRLISLIIRKHSQFVKGKICFSSRKKESRHYYYHYKRLSYVKCTVSLLCEYGNEL